MSKKNLSFSNAVSQVFWGPTLPNIPEVQDMIHWRDTTNVGEGDFTQISKSGDRPTRFWKSLDQIEEESASVGQADKERKFDWTKVYVSHIKTDDGMYYPACLTEKCMKKLSGDDASGIYLAIIYAQKFIILILGWSCFTCGERYNRAPLRYTLSLKIEDGTNCLWVTAFSREAEEILGN